LVCQHAANKAELYLHGVKVMKLFVGVSEQAGRNRIQGQQRVIIQSLILAFLLLFLSSLSLKAATLPPGFTETLVASGLNNPTAMAFAPDGRLFVCQQGGQLRVIKNGVLLATPFLTVSTDATGERGLLGLAFDPNFASNGFIYIYYTVLSAPRHNRVSRFTANGDVAVANSEVVILELNNLSASNHNGGAMHFGIDGKLYIATGENAVQSNSQTLGNLLGKILRINADGSIPTDNPFYNTATGVNRAIWALGLRNPFTFAFQPGTGRMFINDVGASAWEEINDGIAGSNYGWPNTEGPTTNPSFRSPLFSYGHGVSPTTGCAITGGAFYNPAVNRYPSDYLGKYFFADICSGWIRRFDPASGAVVAFASGITSPVDLQVGPDGNLYYLARGGGVVFKVNFTGNQERLQFGAASYSGGEGAGSLQVTVTRTGGASGEATVDYVGSGGTASDRSDYTTLVGTLHFADGETSKTLDVLLTNDGFLEGNETFNLTLGNASGAIIDDQYTTVVTIADDDFAPSPTNPIDETSIFVRQHYHDILDREPEAEGFTYWTTILNGCGTDFDCQNRVRVEISSRFFIELEFQRTGFFVMRMYQASYGQPPSYAQFLADRRQVQNSPESQKLFASQWVQRSAFLTEYPLTLTPSQFVTKLYDKAGVADATARAAAVQGLTNGTKTRADVVWELVERADFQQREYNPAFVRMMYFGYLRREVEANGFAYWMNVLTNLSPNNYRAMICAFINSNEYQLRFNGTRGKFDELDCDW
jgi:glucose/arabinose dehydrogenase